MSGVNTLYVLSAVVLPAGNILQITDSELDPGIEEALVGGSGDLDYGYGSAMSVKPQLSFTSTAVASALGVAGINGYAYSSGTAAFYFRPVGIGSSRTDTACVKIASGAGLVVPKSIKASDDSKTPATISYDAYFLSPDGVTAPLTTSTGQSLPAFSVASEAFALGPLKLNGSFLSTMSSIEFDPGLKCETVKSDGFAYPTWAGISDSRKPKITPKLYDMSQLDALGTSGAALNNGLALTAWSFFLRKIQSGGTRIANATTAHIKIAGTTGFLRHDKHGGSHGKAVDGSYGIFPLFDGTNAIATATTGVAIA